MGPATTVSVHYTVTPPVEVRPVGQAISQLGRRLAYLVLTYQQLDLMQRLPPLAFLTGHMPMGYATRLVIGILCVLLPVTRGWNGYRNKSRHTKLTLEKKLLPPLLSGLEPETFQSPVRRCVPLSYPRSPFLFKHSRGCASHR